MKKRFAAVLTSLLLVMLLVPAAAFATGGHTVEGDLDLTSGKTLENDGYTWDASTHTLTMQDLTVTETIKLPNAECQINVKGNCSVGTIQGGSDAVTLTVKGEDGAVLQGNITVNGDLVFENLTMTDGKINNVNVNFKNVMSLHNSNITLHHLSWMTDGGIDLVGSQLTVKESKEFFGQFTVEKIAMDENSVIGYQSR